MQKVLPFIAISLAIFSPLVASAHEWKNDGSIAVLLHAHPGDDPIVGEPAQLLFEITDKDGKFKAEDCNCMVAIRSDGILLANIVQTVSAIPFIFPKKGIYTATISGTPKTPGEFQPFSLDYDIRVAREQTASVSGFSHSYYIVAGFLLLGGAALYFKNKL